MAEAIFITGTDTGVGKTMVSGMLARALLEEGQNVITQKWIQTGSDTFSDDIDTHLELMKRKREDIEGCMQDVAPYVLSFPSSPHLAAEIEKTSIDAEKIKNSFLRLKSKFDFVVVEGSGGLKVPISDKTLMVDIVDDLKIPTIIVAENKLGAINQTLLTVDALKERNMPILGIIFNRLSEGMWDEIVLKDNKSIVERISQVEVLGELGFSRNFDFLYEGFRRIAVRILEKVKS